jgi:hypothetical protein
MVKNITVAPQETYVETSSDPSRDKFPCVGLKPKIPFAAAGPTMLPRPKRI